MTIVDCPNLAPWQTLYEIVGCSGGALVGLQFVVIALIANSRTKADFQAINAFGTPNVVHFSMALAIAAIMSAPWRSMVGTSVIMGIFGVLGLAYSATVFRRAGRQTSYKPVAEDWIWYAIVPCCIYGVLTVAAVLLPIARRAGLFMVAAAALGLLLIGIRNAWDSVTHIVAGGSGAGEGGGGEAKKPE